MRRQSSNSRKEKFKSRRLDSWKITVSLYLLIYLSIGLINFIYFNIFTGTAVGRLHDQSALRRKMDEFMLVQLGSASETQTLTHTDRN